MSKDVSSKSSKAGKRWLHLATRILVAVVMLFVAVGFIVNATQLVGVWFLRASTSSAVTDVAATATHALDTVNNGLGRVNTQVQDARQKLTQVNDAVAKLGNRIDASSPLVTALNQLVNTDLAPRIDNVRTTASSVHDAVVSFNSILVALNRVPNVTVPTLNSQLEAVSDRAQEAQAAFQDLRTTLAGVKTGVATTVEGAITNLTARIDAALVRIQAIVSTYQATVTHIQERITTISNNFLLLLNIAAVSLTLLFIIFGAGLVLLEYVCWLYVRTGRFPSLRIVSTSKKVLKEEATATPTKVVEAKEAATSKEVLEQEVTTVPAQEVESKVIEAKEPTTSKEVLEQEATTVPAEVVQAEGPATSKSTSVIEESADPDTEGTT